MSYPHFTPSLPKKVALGILVAVCLGSVAVMAAPANDNFSSASALTGASATDTVSNVDATKESGEDNHAGDPGGLSVWWTWTAESDGLLTLSTTGSVDEFDAPLDTVLAVYTGVAVNDLSAVVSNDQDTTGTGTSFAQLLATSGVTYYIAVDSSASFGAPVGGTVRLTLAFNAAGNNDNLADRAALSGTHDALAGTNVGATRESGEATHGGTGGASVWWEWTSSFDGPVTFSTEGSSIDTLMAIYEGTGDSHASLSLVANDDDSGSNLTSLILLTAEAGKTYIIAIDGKNGAVGAFNLCFSQGLPAHIDAIQRLGDGSCRLTITASAACRLQIEAKADLANPSGWARVPLGRLNDVSGTIQFTDSAAIGQDSRFYRIVAP